MLGLIHYVRAVRARYGQDEMGLKLAAVWLMWVPPGLTVKFVRSVHTVRLYWRYGS
jgi:hypothetical protein